ncbi:patatin-like phospholipase domain-containing protein 2 isoform X2 [Natator depressus]|uniref:patatin-like phospholipase domain-containing protein 2 isoform X2 n=1 Tax=Natator depressus TaxID=27790 RepID=UPI003EBDFA82
MFDRERGWSVSFAGCGFLGVYHIGAATCLQERAPHLVRDARKIFGASAGALAGAVLVGGGSLAEACADVLGLAKEARKRSLGPLHPSFNVIKIIRDGLFKNLPENTHQLSAGKLCISLTRVSDGKNVLVSNFNSKEEIVQALICSSFVPIYCGLIPPSFRGVVLGEICEQGYSDALRFLKENDILNDSVYVDLSLKKNPQELIEDTDFTNKKTIPERKGTEEILKTKMLSNQLKLNTWPLDERIFEHLPPRLRKALQEACKEKSGFYAQLSKLLPMRVMSYLILPYTLPVESAYSVALRLVDWFPDIPDDFQWMQGQLRRIVSTVYSRARNKLLSTSSKESYASLRKCQTVPPNVEFHSPYCHSKVPHSAADLEGWLWDFLYCRDSAGKQISVGIKGLSDSDSHHIFFMNSEESGLETDFDSSSDKSFQTASED